MKITLLQRAALLGVAASLAIPSLASAQDKGQALYKSKCAACHGADGGGSKGMGTKPLSDYATMSDADLTSAIANGKGKMPAYKGKLTDAQISDLVSYVKSMAK